MIINDAGTYTLKYTATDDCGKTSTVDRELVVIEPVHVYGARWDGTSNPAWVRTDESADFADPIPQHSDGNGGWVGGSSPFDDIYPWSNMQIVEDADAGTLVSIPKFYYKLAMGLGSSGYGMQLQISNAPQEGFSVSPAHMDRGDGVGERDVVYIGRYHCADDYISKDGVLPTVSKTRDAFRQGIHALGSDIWQIDFAMYWTVCMLYLVEFANWNSQAKVGGGCSDSGTIQNMGLTDGMTYHTGTTNATVGAENYGHIQYRYIEDMWANVSDFCDGIRFSGRDVYVIKNPSEFSDSANGTLVGQRHDGSGVTKGFFTPPTGYEYAVFTDAAGGTDYTEYVCDSYVYGANGTVLCFGGTFWLEQNSGLFKYVGHRPSDFTQNSIGSRLMKLPNA